MDVITENAEVIEQLASDFGKECEPAPLLWRFVVTPDYRVAMNKLIGEKVSMHPREFGNDEEFVKKFPQYFANVKMQPAKMKEEIATLKTQNCTTFSLADKKLMDPPLKPFKAHTRKSGFENLRYCNFAGVYFASTEGLKFLTKVKQLEFLCFHDCGLLCVPPQLYKLPPALKNLDLSLNFIESVPAEVKWEQLEGLNLDENALHEFPAALAAERTPNLKSLTMAFNPVGKGGAIASGPQGLTHLNMSYCGLDVVPQFVYQCMELQELRLRGNGSMKGIDWAQISKLSKCGRIDISGVPLPSLDNEVVLSKTIKVILAKGGKRSEIPQGNYSVIT